MVLNCLFGDREENKKDPQIQQQRGGASLCLGFAMAAASRIRNIRKREMHVTLVLLLLLETTPPTPPHYLIYAPNQKADPVYNG
jgi:hypothetical protein